MAMQGYTKLFNSILASTVWLEDNDTRIVWIAMLAMADKNGLVEASMPGLAAIARVPQEACQAALVKLEAPDIYSRTKDHEGRRVAPVDGGWRILNHAKYRAKMSADERREYNRIKQREFRGRQSITVNDGNSRSALSAHTEADTDTKEREKQHPSPTKPVGVARELGSPEFLQFWEAYPKRVDRLEALKAWVRGFCDASLHEILAGLEKWKATEQWSDSDKIPYPSTWLNKRRWNEVPDRNISKAEQKARKTDEAIERVRTRLHPRMGPEAK